MTVGKNGARKLLGSLVVGGLLVGVVGIGAYSAFTATTTNSGNNISSGTVAISQHAGATTLIDMPDAAPGASVSKCVRVTYTGSLAASVQLYASAGITNGDKYSVKVERGSGLSSPDNTMSCSGFTQSSDALDTADLNTFPTTYGTGLSGKPSNGAWAQNDAVDYKITATVKDDATANAHTSANSSGAFTLTWEARNN